MAPSDALTQAYRDALMSLKAASLKELLAVSPLLRVDAVDASFGGWATAVTGVVTAYRDKYAGMSVAYYQALRAANGVPGAVAVEPMGALSEQEQAALTVGLRVTGVAQIKTAAARGVTSDGVTRAAFVASSGVATRHMASSGWGTILRGVRGDPQATGWRRVTSGKACGFCQMLAGRGAVYKEDTAHFAAHDHCHCTAEPEWGNNK